MRQDGGGVVRWDGGRRYSSLLTYRDDEPVSNSFS